MKASMVDRPRARMAHLEIVLERWSSEEERTRLVDALRQGWEQGAAALRAVRPSVGTMRDQGQPAWTIQYAHAKRTADGGLDVVLVAEDPVTSWPTQIGQQARDAISVATIHLDSAARGKGQFGAVAQLTYDLGARTIDVKDYLSTPIRLRDVVVAAPVRSDQ